MHEAKGEHKAHVKDVRSWKRARVKGALRSEVKQSEVKRSEGDGVWLLAACVGV